MRVTRSRRAVSALIVASLVPLAARPVVAAVGPWYGTAQAKVRLVSPWTVAVAPGPLWLALDFRLEPEWHVYWKNSGDAGFPPRVEFTGTPEIVAAELHFPAPKRFDLPGGLVAFGYEHAVLYPISTRLRRIDGESLHICADLDFLVCREECIPYRTILTLVQPIGAPAIEDPSTVVAFDESRRLLPRPLAAVPGAPGVETAWRRVEGHQFEIELAFRGGNLRADRLDLFFDPSDLFAIGRPTLSVTSDGYAFRVPVRPLDETKPLPVAALFRWTATGFVGSDGPLALQGENAVSLRLASTTPVWIATLLAFIVFIVVLRRWRHARPDSTAVET